MKTVVVVLNWNGWKDTARLVASLKEHRIALPIWVVDNGSAVDESRLIAAADASVRIVRLDRNYGFAGGMNRAVRKAADEGYAFVYAINNDCLARDDFVAPCVDAATADRQLAVVGSRYLSRDKHGAYTLWGFHSNPAERESFRDGILLCDRVVGCGMLIAVDAFHAVGGFNEVFFCYGEEDDLCWRLLKRGYRVGICFASLILHDHEGSDVAGNAAYYRARNSFLLSRRHPEKVTPMRCWLDVIDVAWRSLAKADVTATLASAEGLHHGYLRREGQRGQPFAKPVAFVMLVGYSVVLLPIWVVRLLLRQMRRT